ncbi:hypothetical protein P167DRAFT_539588 [Morchella conica CCBAS932]|uniref:Zn(2)-C6 fungal-type domain-containing protein n=1 Tax=Morchella conica CCBAS932 TaxID=1392247 RepID=A0A3N4KC14_9PEZI|nr:hypothetical protein P167DRAFT_539588 [Morchella conica CCBAS932]
MSAHTSQHSHHDDSDGANNSNSGKQGERHSARNPACDLCREKKVRCGREKPTCQNCIAWKTPCTYSERQKRDNEASRNAQRFEEVHDRLDRIESTMSRLLTAFETAQSLRTPAPTPPVFRPTPLPGLDACSPKDPVRIRPGEYSLRLPKPADPRRDMQYLGPSSMLGISIEAGSLAEETLRQKSPAAAGGGGGGGGGSGEGGQADASGEEIAGGAKSSEQVETIGALKKLSSISSNVASWFPYYGHAELRLGAGGASMAIPEREEAEALANEYFRKVHVWFPIFDEARFLENMAKYYAGDPKLSKDRAWLVCFNNVLLFGVFNRTTSRQPVEPGIGRNFFLNGWAAIDDLEVFLAPRLANIQALLTGAVIAIEISRPGLCWSLLSQAARLSQAIGLHRRTPSNTQYTKSELQERRCIFWNVYVLDKCLSLTFGRSTCLPDFDCDTELPEDDGTSPYFKNFLALIQLAKIQSNIYVRLYSASAARMTDEERDNNIATLDLELRNWWAEKKAIFFTPETGASDKPLDVFSRLELRFSYLCSLTLVHRTARPGAASERVCLESARESIVIINEVVESSFDIANSGMIMWLFQYYPFTAFFVLFSAIIRNPSAPTSKEVDFQLMKGLVSYLGRMKEKNEGAAKLLQIASAFTHVAGTFLKNYGKIEQQRGGEHGGKRRRRDAGSDGEETGGITPEDGWLQEGASDGHKVFVRGYGKGFWGTTAFPRDQVEQVFTPETLAASAGTGGGGDASTTASGTAAPTPPAGWAPAGEVDLHPASFLKWPGAGVPDGHMPMDMGVDEAPVFDMDLTALMEEPEGFQMQMEQAAMRGPLEFDWFSWEGSAGGV